MLRIPPKGKSKEEIFQTLESYKGDDLDWKSGRVMGYVYDPGEKAKEVINHAYTMYLSENALDPLTYPSLLRLENGVNFRLLFRGQIEPLGHELDVTV